MHTCIKQLLEEVGNPKPEDVECMCKLLATVGGLLDASTKQVKNFNNGKPASTKVSALAAAMLPCAVAFAVVKPSMTSPPLSWLATSVGCR